MSPPVATIFVQIASYRDPECRWTVADLFAKAKRPDRIHVGVCLQWNPDTDRDCGLDPSIRPGQVGVISVLPRESEGVCWARARTQTLFRDQDYVLMIDSHMRFAQGWDDALIDELSRCDSAKPFLSSYPPGYKPPHFLQPDPGPTVMRAKPFSPEGDIRFDGEVLRIRPDKPLPGAFLAAGLVFAPGRFVREVPYDPRIYFDHEEMLLAVRAYTHGWDVFSPTWPVIYHYYHTPGDGPRRFMHWEDRPDWTRLRDISRLRFNFLLRGIKPDDATALTDIEKFALGRERSLADYEKFSGIGFGDNTVSERALRSGFVPDIERYRCPPATVVPETPLPTQ